MKKTILQILVVIITLTSCNKDEIEVYNKPFVHINFNNLSTSTYMKCSVFKAIIL